jgi:predicted phosphodiesterase
MLIGILADTHIPYRAAGIPDAVIDTFKDVDLILHAGDVDESWALHPLEEISPVLAVSGNYHVIDRSSGGKHFPSVQKVSFCGFTIVMTHGHRIGWSTLFWRFYGLISIALGKVDSPIRDRFFGQTLIRQHPGADIIVFGHTHRYYSQFINGKLVINPGAACAASYFDIMPETTVALLHIDTGRLPEVERIDLNL